MENANKWEAADSTIETLMIEPVIEIARADTAAEVAVESERESWIAVEHSGKKRLCTEDTSPSTVAPKQVRG